MFSHYVQRLKRNKKKNNKHLFIRQQYRVRITRYVDDQYTNYAAFNGRFLCTLKHISNMRVNE